MTHINLLKVENFNNLYEAKMRVMQCIKEDCLFIEQHNQDTKSKFAQLIVN